MVGFLVDDEVDDAWVVGALALGWPVKVSTMWLGSSGDVAQRLLRARSSLAVVNIGRRQRVHQCFQQVID